MTKENPSWPIASLGSKVDFSSGGTPRKSEPTYWGGDIPWVSSGEITHHRIADTTLHVTDEGANNGTRKVPPKTILAVVRGMSLAKEFRVAISTRELTFNQDIKAIRPKDEQELDPEFLLYYLLSQNGPIRDSASEAAHGTKKLDMPVLEQWPLPLPPLTVQRKITAVLSAYDDLIENNNKRIALLEKAAEEIYREWFVRLRFPGWETAVFHKGVPEGWELRRGFGHVKGKSYTSKEINEDGEGLPFINLKSINRGGGYRDDGLKFYTGRYRDNQIAHPNDIVMAVTDMTQNRDVVGRVARIPEASHDSFVISLDIIKIVPKKISTTFLYCYLRYSGFGHFVKEFANGANVLHLKPDLVSKQKIVVPTKKLQEKFEEVVTPILSQIDALNRKNENLQKSRDLLLPRLISGKLSVDDFDIQFPPSMMTT